MRQTVPAIFFERLQLIQAKKFAVMQLVCNFVVMRFVKPISRNEPRQPE